MTSDTGTNILPIKEDSPTGRRRNLSITDDRDEGTVEHEAILQHTTEQTRATASDNEVSKSVPALPRTNGTFRTYMGYYRY